MEPLTTNGFMGIWRFPDRISLPQLIALATRMIEDQTWSHYDVCVRQIAAHQMGICVIVDVADMRSAGDVEQRYIDYFSPLFRTLLGDEVFGWDIAVPLWIAPPVAELPAVNAF
jgi:hypothetical protein